VSEACSFPCETDIRPTDWRAEHEFRIKYAPHFAAGRRWRGLPDPLRVRTRDDTRAPVLAIENEATEEQLRHE